MCYIYIGLTNVPSIFFVRNAVCRCYLRIASLKTTPLKKIRRLEKKPAADRLGGHLRGLEEKTVKAESRTPLKGEGKASKKSWSSDKTSRSSKAATPPAGGGGNPGVAGEEGGGSGKARKGSSGSSKVGQGGAGRLCPGL